MIRPEELIFSSFFIADDWPIHLTWCTFYFSFFFLKKKRNFWPPALQNGRNHRNRGRWQCHSNKNIISRSLKVVIGRQRNRFEQKSAAILFLFPIFFENFADPHVTPQWSNQPLIDGHVTLGPLSSYLSDYLVVKSAAKVKIWLVDGRVTWPEQRLPMPFIKILIGAFHGRLNE